jgi:hypothetical protein
MVVSGMVKVNDDDMDIRMGVNCVRLCELKNTNFRQKYTLNENYLDKISILSVIVFLMQACT